MPIRHRRPFLATLATGWWLAFCTPPTPAAAWTAPDGPVCGIAALPGLSAQYARALRETREASGVGYSGGTLATAGRPSTLAAGPAADFWRVASAILGAAGAPLVAAADAAPFDPVGGAPDPDLPCDRAVRSRDHTAWSMGLGGYSGREIADVLSGHLSRADLDDAVARLMAGQPRPLVAAFLESRWREPVTHVAMTRPQPPPLPALAYLDADLTALAARHGVSADLVRAVVAAESAGNQRAVSPAGAIGLMQLMPATAASLGVDPWQPLQNLQGGIAYLASLLHAYGGNTRLALVAYNAGPQHANRVRDGSAVAYRETRRYLEAVNARFPLP